jgi:hypothetical protein
MPRHLRNGLTIFAPFSCQGRNEQIPSRLQDHLHEMVAHRYDLLWCSHGGIVHCQRESAWEGTWWIRLITFWALQFVVVVWGRGNGDLGQGCNEGYNESCQLRESMAYGVEIS